VKTPAIGPNGRVVSFIDIGTNSVRLLVVRLNPNHSYSILSRQKQQVRLVRESLKKKRFSLKLLNAWLLSACIWLNLHGHFKTDGICCCCHVCHAGGSKPAGDPASPETGGPGGMCDNFRTWRSPPDLPWCFTGFHLGNRPGFFHDIGAEARKLRFGGEQNYRYLESFKLVQIRLSNLTWVIHYLPDLIMSIRKSSSTSKMPLFIQSGRYRNKKPILPSVVQEQS